MTAEDPHADQRAEWRRALAASKKQQRRDRWKRAAPRTGAGMARLRPQKREET